MARNLKYQLNYIINQNFKEGVSKHSLKSDGSRSEHSKVYSYAERKNLIDTTSKLANYMSEKYPEVKYVRDIQNTHIQSFLNDNAQGWTRSTIDVRCSHISKLERLAEQTYKGSNFNFYHDIVKPTGRDNTREIAMTRQDYNKLLLHTRESTSESRYAIEFAGRFGLRVAELSKLQYRDIQQQENGSYRLNIVDSKGGRDRVIEVTKESDKSFLGQFKGSETDRIIPYQSDSINKFVNRHLEACGLTQYIDAKTSIHSIRKMVAQEKFDECRANGQTRQESLDTVSHFLGHNDNRNDLMARYIGNIY